MKYLAVLGRQPEISIAELESKFPNAHFSTGPATDFPPKFCFANISGGPQSVSPVDINQLGGTLKLAIELTEKPLDFLRNLPEGKITFGISDYSKNASRKTATIEALKLKKILARHNRSVRVVENKEATLSTATSLHNGLSGKNERKVELIKLNNDWYKVIGVQDIDAYSKRDQARPARDAKVGMLPPKLAQILINLCGPLKSGARILDPFCGTGVVLQEALLMGYHAYGTDINPRMIEYSEKNLEWLLKAEIDHFSGRVRPARRHGRTALPLALPGSGFPQNDYFQLSTGDATTFQWQSPIDAVACEGYLGKPMSTVPSEIKLKTEKQECTSIILGFLKNLADQIKSDTPVVIACPAWLREDGNYSRLEILDEIENMGYNVDNKSREGLLYHRDSQIVARDIIILRKK